jgi:hypothetical protein
MKRAQNHTSRISRFLVRRAGASYGGAGGVKPAAEREAPSCAGDLVGAKGALSGDVEAIPLPTLIVSGSSTDLYPRRSRQRA